MLFGVQIKWKSFSQEKKYLKLKHYSVLSLIIVVNLSAFSFQFWSKDCFIKLLNVCSSDKCLVFGLKLKIFHLTSDKFSHLLTNFLLVEGQKRPSSSKPRRSVLGPDMFFNLLHKHFYMKPVEYWPGEEHTYNFAIDFSFFSNFLVFAFCQDAPALNL